MPIEQPFVMPVGKEKRTAHLGRVRDRLRVRIEEAQKELGAAIAEVEVAQRAVLRWEVTLHTLQEIAEDLADHGDFDTIPPAE